jgi:iron complex transport system substrate-binding protein
MPSAVVVTLLCLILPFHGPRKPEADATRVVSLVPAATEILIALGAADLLVARTEADRDAALAALPSVGHVLAPNVEVLASVEPDLVIAWAGSDLQSLARLVERRGGRVERVALDRLGQVGPTMRRIGAWTGRPAEADSLAAWFARTLDAARATGNARAAALAGRRPRVLWVVSSEPLVVAGPGTFISDVIDVAGGANAAEGVDTAWPRLGIESVMALDPDLLVWPDGPGMFPLQELRTRGAWRAIEAVRADRVLAVDAKRFHDPGPELARATLELAQRLAQVETR